MSNTIHSSRVVEDIAESLKRGEHVDLTLCNLSKAFDCASYELFMNKMLKYLWEVLR